MKKIFLILTTFLLFNISAYPSDTYIDGKKYDDFEISDWRGISAPSASPSSQSRIYFDSTSNTLKLSQNGGTYYDIVTSTFAGHYLPATDNTYDLGEASTPLRWRNLYLIGNAAIGTLSPSGPFHVANADDDAFFLGVTYGLDVDTVTSTKSGARFTNDNGYIELMSKASTGYAVYASATTGRGAYFSDGTNVVYLGSGDGTYALYVDGLTGLGTSSPNARLDVESLGIDTDSTWLNLLSTATKTAGATDDSDDMVAFRSNFTMNDADSEIGNLYGFVANANLTTGTVGKSAWGCWVRSNLDGGTVQNDAEGMRAIVDQEAGNTVDDDINGIFIQVDADGTVGGDVSMLFLDEKSNIDYGIYQSGTAPNLLGGNLTTNGNAQLGNGVTDYHGINTAPVSGQVMTGVITATTNNYFYHTTVNFNPAVSGFPSAYSWGHFLLHDIGGSNNSAGSDGIFPVGYKVDSNFGAALSGSGFNEVVGFDADMDFDGSIADSAQFEMIGARLYCDSDLGTTGTTAHTPLKLRASGTADTNTGLTISASGATTNNAISITAGDTRTAGDLYLDDGSGASPFLRFQDQTDDYMNLSKDNSGDYNSQIFGDNADSFDFVLLDRDANGSSNDYSSLKFGLENDAGGTFLGAEIKWILSDATNGSEDMELSILTAADGGSRVEAVGIDEYGNVDIAGSLDVEDGITDESLKAYYRFNGNVLDATDNGSDGTVMAEASTTTHVLSLDGTDDAVKVTETTSVDLSSNAIRNIYPVSTDINAYEMASSLAIDSSGYIYCAYRTAEGNTHGFDADGKVGIRRSTDGGETWSAEAVVNDEANVDERRPVLSIIDDGGVETLICVYTRDNDTDADKRAKTEKTTVANWDTWNGAVADVNNALTLATGGPVIQLSTGDLLLAVYDNITGDDTYLYKSTDDGDSWSSVSTINGANGDECSLMETKTGGSYTGGVYAVIRDNAGKYDYTTSTDYGATWAAVAEETDLPVSGGTFCDLLRLSDDTILACHSKNDDVYFETYIYTSTDECATWTKDVEILHGCSNSAYPGMLEIDSDSFAVSWALNGNGTVSSDIYVKLMDYPFVELPETGVMSAFMWIKRDDLSNWDSPIAKDEIYNAQSFALRFEGVGDELTLAMSAKFMTDDATSVGDLEWHHIGFTKTTRTAVIYVDGEAVETGYYGAILNNDLDLLIGVRYDDSETPSYAGYFDGLIDDVRIYDRALSAGEVRRLYESEDYNIVHANDLTLLDDATVGDELHVTTAVAVGNTSPQRPIHVTNATPHIRLEDSDALDIDDVTGYLEFGYDDGAWARQGYFGFTSSGDDNMEWKNESSGGNIELRTNAGPFWFFAGTDEDVQLSFIGTSHNGFLWWMEDEDYFEFKDVALFKDKILLTQTDGNEYIDSLNDGYVDIGATTAIRNKAITIFEDAVYFTQTDGAEKIDSDGDGDIDYYAGTSHDFIIGATEQITFTDGKLAPTTTNDIDLGDSTHAFKDVYFTGITTMGGGQFVNRTTVNDQDYTVLTGDFIVAYTALTAQRTVTLPDALAVEGRRFCIKDEAGAASGSNIVIDPEGGTTIDGAATITLSTDYDFIAVYSDGNNWYTTFY